jgi:beta-glucosidase
MKKQMQSALTLAFAVAVPAALAATPDERAAAIVAQMTLAEKIQTVFGYFSTDFNGVPRPKEGCRGPPVSCMASTAWAFRTGS